MSLMVRDPNLLKSVNPFFDEPIFNDVLWPSLFTRGRATDVMTPRVDVVENGDTYCVTTDLPGVDKDDIELTIDGGVLTIKATSESESKEEKDGQIIRQERYSGQYLRRFDLGSNVSDKDIDAHFENGVLKITAKKIQAKTSEPKKIKVK